LLLATGRKAHKAKGTKVASFAFPFAFCWLAFYGLPAVAKSKGCLSCLSCLCKATSKGCKATLCLWRMQRKGKRSKGCNPCFFCLCVAEVKSKGCAAPLLLRSGQKGKRARVFILILIKITFAFGYSSRPNRPGAGRAYSPASSKRPASRRQKEQRLRLLPLPFAFAFCLLGFTPCSQKQR
jgi:hypothetical protein